MAASLLHRTSFIDHKESIKSLTCKEVEEQSFMEDLNRDYNELQDPTQAGPLISPLFEGVMRPGGLGLVHWLTLLAYCLPESYCSG